MNVLEIFPKIKEKQYFQNAETKEFWFHASGTCQALGFTNVQSALALYCDDDEKLMEILNGKATWFVSEAGFYGLAMGAKTSEAKAFKRKLKHDILPKLRASRNQTTDAASLLNGFPDMQQRFENLLEIEAKYLKALETSFNEPAIALNPFPYTLGELHEDSGITSKSYVSNVVRLGFKLDEDYQGYRFGDNKITPKRISQNCYNILMICFRSARGIDLTKMPSIITIERDRYYAQRQPKKNRLYSHPDQMSLF